MTETINDTETPATNLKEEIELLELDDSVNEDERMLTTTNNPFSPKTQYDDWKQWDNDNGYNTEEYIARLLNMEGSYDVDDEFKINMLTSKVIADILANDDEEIYCLV